MDIFLIAEIGINHNGNINIAKKLIDAAADAGFDAVKFQKRTIEKVYTKEFLNLYRESPWGNTQGNQKYGLEFNYEDYLEIDKYCKEKNIKWSASAWDLESQEFIASFNVDFNNDFYPVARTTRIVELNIGYTTMPELKR